VRVCIVPKIGVSARLVASKAWGLVGLPMHHRGVYSVLSSSSQARPSLGSSSFSWICCVVTLPARCHLLAGVPMVFCWEFSLGVRQHIFSQGELCGCLVDGCLARAGFPDQSALNLKLLACFYFSPRVFCLCAWGSYLDISHSLTLLTRYNILCSNETHVLPYP